MRQPDARGCVVPLSKVPWPRAGYAVVIPKGTKVKEKRTKYLKFFENLLYDAVYLAYSAYDIDTEKDEAGYEFTLIRSSILNTMLLERISK